MKTNIYHRINNPIELKQDARVHSVFDIKRLILFSGTYSLLAMT